MLSETLKIADCIGKKFGKWTLLEDLGCEPVNSIHKVKCRCECGREKAVDWRSIKRGLSNSCVHCVKHTNSTKHAKSYKKERLYPIWQKMCSRCHDKRSKDYVYYGARGIKVCNEWLNDYFVFRAWAYATGYDDKAPYGKCTLDRIDVNGDYCSENCRWVDLIIQNRNKNKQKNNKSGYIGIYFTNYKYRPWQSTIGMNGKIIYIGYYTTKKEAVEARNKYIIDNNLTEYKIQEWKDE